jgi:hypothetical protein
MKKQSIGFHLDRLRELSERANGEEYTDIGELWELAQALADATADRLGYAPLDWDRGPLIDGS